VTLILNKIELINHLPVHCQTQLRQQQRLACFVYQNTNLQIFIMRQGGNKYDRKVEKYSTSRTPSRGPPQKNFQNLRHYHSTLNNNCEEQSWNLFMVLNQNQTTAKNLSPVQLYFPEQLLPSAIYHLASTILKYQVLELFRK
jgi:hypothetical protein